VQKPYKTRYRPFGFAQDKPGRNRIGGINARVSKHIIVTPKEHQKCIYVETFAVPEKSLHRICPRCKKGTLITLLTFDGRGPPKDYEQTIKRKLLEYNT